MGTIAVERKRVVLLVEDDPSVRFGIAGGLRARGFIVVEADACDAAVSAFRANRPDAVVTDLRLPDGDALGLLARMRGIDESVPVFIITGYGTIDTAVRAVKEGAEDFLTKPVELSRLDELVTRSLNRSRFAPGGTSSVQRNRVPQLQSASDQVKQLDEQIERLRDADCSVLILGETGTGKSLLARRIHRIGARASGPFVDVNCAGLTKEFVESELFGHERGAFTGAHAPKVGLLDSANGGTLFLDEIGDIDPQVQPKVLKVLEEKRFRRMGDVRERTADVRLLAATHHELFDAVARKAFRADLYYRISTVTLHVPALRDRLEDLPMLARDILDAKGCPEVVLGRDAEARLRSYDWPGNIRELKNVLERAALLRSGDVLSESDIVFQSANPSSSAIRIERPASSRLLANDATSATRQEIEREHIRLALLEENGKVEATARRLGIPRSTLYQRLKLYGIDPSAIRRAASKDEGTV